MNKKLLFAALSLAAFTACTDDNFESQKQLAEKTFPVEFELINSSDATRASMDSEYGTTVVWTADDNDLFTLYHGCPDLFEGDVVGPWTKGYENATYKASSDGKNASLTTPAMIKAGAAIMVWPCDTTFRIDSEKDLSLVIPAEQNNIENNLPYVSDLLNIGAYAPYSEEDPGRTDYNTAGYNRKYPVFMRPMASQLNLKPNYIGKDLIDGLTTGTEPIEPITIDSVKLLTAEGTLFTTGIRLKFNNPTDAQLLQWNLATNHRAWEKVTAFDLEHITAQTDQLTSTCFDKDRGICKFLFLPQALMNTDGEGVNEAAIVIKTYYGQVIVGTEAVGGKYTFNPDDPNAGEIGNAWYRFIAADNAAAAALQAKDGEATKESPESAGDGAGKYMCYSKPEFGMKQTINWFTDHTGISGVAKGEPDGGATTRWLNVYLKYLDMSDLHIKSDKQLYDVVRVWDALNLAPVTVYLDGDANNEFIIKQKTIEKINAINAANADEADDELPFKVKPCGIEDHTNCDRIVITGSDYKQQIQDVAFIAANPMDLEDEEDDVVADVVFANEGATAKPWIWEGTVQVAAAGVNKFINEGAMENALTAATSPATLKTKEFGEDGEQNNILLENKGTWNVKGGSLYVQFDVTNFGELSIAKGAEYLEAGVKHTFTNEALTLPERFLAEGVAEQIGKVENKGVFATTDNGTINNYGLIEHADVDAKTYISSNQKGNGEAAPDFGTAFNNVNNKFGQINLPWSNKDEDNISISAALKQGFVSVTIDDKATLVADETGKVILNNESLGQKVNYVIINDKVDEIAQLNPSANADQVKYLEINRAGKEIYWSVDETTRFDGLIVLSNINIKLNTKVAAKKGAYLNAKMYVGGEFNWGLTAAELAAWDGWNGYYGVTKPNFATLYITY